MLWCSIKPWDYGTTAIFPVILLLLGGLITDYSGAMFNIRGITIDDR